MMKLTSLLLLILLTGCATYVTNEGQRIKVIHDRSTELVSDCKQLSVVHGEAGSFLSGGDYGLFYATNDARNKAAQISGADTLLIMDSNESIFGGDVTGMAYRCNPDQAKKAPVVNAPSKDVTDNVTNLPPQRSPEIVPPDKWAEKAEKCRKKGGVWCNQQCIIPIE